jgi:predicted Zn-dependent peptidase
MEMLLRVLDDGMSTRLYDRICDSRGLCYDVSALYEAYEDDGVIDVAAEVHHERAVDVVTEVLGLVRALAEDGPTERELSKAKARHFWQMRNMLDEPEATASFHALGTLAGIAATPAARHAELRAVTAEQVRDVARFVFRPERLGVVTVGTLRDKDLRALHAAVSGFCVRG